MQMIARSRLPLPLAAAIVLTVLAAPVRPLMAGASRPADDTTMPAPANCVQQSPARDYRCAGLMLPGSLWAGQWLVVDAAGGRHRGTCTFHLGTHPTTAVPAVAGVAALPGDPTGVLSGYLAWKYGDTDDDLTAAAMWALMHVYAQDSAGSGPLIPRLGAIGAVTGRADIQQRANELAAEAERFAGEWSLTVTLAVDGTATVTVRVGSLPVPDRPITLLVSGNDLPLEAITSADGTTTVAVPLPPSGTVTVVASTSAPGPAVLFRGQPATPDPDGVQTLLSAGAPVVVQATARLQIVPPKPPAETTTTVSDPTTVTPMTGPPVTEPPLPDTGRGDRGVAHVATALLVGGIGLLGTLRRREVHLPGGRVDSRG